MNALIIISGLPCTGKSALSEAIARTTGFPVFSVDPIESAIWQAGIKPSHETGVAAYEVAAALAGERLKLGQSAIVDAVSPIEWARRRWRSLAARYGARLVVIEIVCSDLRVHRERVQKRVRNIPGMPEVTWERVEQRREEFEPWQGDRLLLDSLQPLSELEKEAIRYIQDKS